MKKLALTFYSVLRMSIDDIIACSKAAEEAGFEFISVAESFYRDASVLATAIASNTNRIKFGSSIYPIPTRTPFQIAMATSTLNEVSKGRVGFIGLGAGYKSRIEKFFGVKQENTLRKMQEYIEMIRGLHSGSEFTYHGRFYCCDGFPPMTSQRLHIPILLAASGNQMLDLAGRLADGVILNSIGTSEYYEHVMHTISLAAKEHGRSIENLQIAASIIFSVGETHEKAIKAARPDVLFYLLYSDLDPVIEKTPFVGQVKQIRQLHNQGNVKDASSLVTDEMVEDLSICGTPAECQSKLRNLSAQGITLPILRVSVQPLDERERKAAFLSAIETVNKI